MLLVVLVAFCFCRSCPSPVTADDAAELIPSSIVMPLTSMRIADYLIEGLYACMRRDCERHAASTKKPLKSGA